MDAPETVDTAYGTVDAAVLRNLKGSLPTSDLLKAADSIEARRLWLRSSLLRLHGMARHLIDGAPLTVTAVEPIWQLADEIADELDASTVDLSGVTKLVDRLGRLRPPDH